VVNGRPLDDDGSSSVGRHADLADSEHLHPVPGKSKPALVSIIVAALVLVTALGASAVVIMVGILPTWALVLVIGFDLLVAVGLAMVLWRSSPRRHGVRFWICMVLAVMMILGNGVALKVGTDYLRFGWGIQGGPKDTVMYDIVALTSGPAAASELTGTAMGEVTNDPLAQAVHEEVGKLASVTFVPVTPWTQLINGLIGGQFPAIVIEDGFMQVLEGADSGAYGQLKIIASFEIDASRAVQPTTTPTPTPTQPVGRSYIIYISGIDTYGSISTRSRSDVNILMVVNPDRGQVLLVNTPRDFYVQLRGTTGLKDKLTHAGVYGIDVSMGTLEDLYDVSINYYLRINFSSLVTVVDTLGGVDVDSAYAFSAGGYTFKIGMNHLDGKAALAFSRERHSFAEGDRVRGENQERVIEAVIHKLVNPAVLANYSSILSAVQSSLQTSMPLDELSTLVGHQLTTGQSWNVKSISVNGSDAHEYTYSYPGQTLYVMIPDQATVDAAKAEIMATLK